MSALLRSSKILRCFGGLARNIGIGANKEDNTSQLIASYPLSNFENHSRFLSAQPLVSSYSINNESENTSNLERSFQRLDSDIKRWGRINYKDVCEIYENIKESGSISSSQSLLLLRCCGSLVAEELPENRTALVQNVWSTLQSLDVPMDISHYNVLLSVYLENEHEFAPGDFLAYLRSEGIEPNRVTFQRILTRYCMLGDIDGATRTLEEMKENGLAINEHVFNALVVGHARAGDLESAENMISVMRRTQLDPSSETYRHLACAFAKQGRLEDVWRVLEEAERGDTPVLARDLLEVIYVTALEGHQEAVCTLIDKLKTLQLFNNDVICLALRLVNRGHNELAFRLVCLLNNMRRPAEQEDQPSSEIDPFYGSYFIKQLIKSNQPAQDVLMYCRQLREQGMNTRAILVALHKALDIGNCELSEQLLRALPDNGFPIRPHYFWPLFTMARASDNFSETLRIVGLMRELDCRVNKETLIDYVFPMVHLDCDWHRVLFDLRANGVTYNFSVPCACRHLLENCRLATVVSLCDRYSSIITLTPSYIAGPLATSFVNGADTRSVVTVLGHMLHSVHASTQLQRSSAQLCGDFVESVVTALKKTATDFNERLRELLQALLDSQHSLSSLSVTSLQSALSDQQEMSAVYDLLEQLVTDTESAYGAPATETRDSFLPIHVLESNLALAKQTNGDVYTAQINLLRSYIRSRDIDKAVILRKEIEESNQDALPISILASWLSMHIGTNHVDDAVISFAHLREVYPEDLSDIRVMKVARLLTQNSRVDEAIELLKAQPRDQLSSVERDSNHYFLNVWRLLNTCAVVGDTASLRRLLDVLVEEQYVPVVRRSLYALLIKSHLSRNDLSAAVDEFEDVYRKHNELVWRSPMMIHLIKTENPELLQRVIDLSAREIGEMDSLYDLAFSLIECGKVRQAKKVLQSPGLRPKSARIEIMCERFTADGNIEALKDLLDASASLVGCDRLKIYDYLLRTHISVGSPASEALAVWTNIQEEGLLASDEMLSRLASYLKFKGAAVPFVEPVVAASVGESPSYTNQSGSTAEANSIKARFKRAIKQQLIDEALRLRNLMLSDHMAPSIHDLTLLVEMLARHERFQEACDVTCDMLVAGTFPQPKVFKFLLSRLAGDGRVADISRLGEHITEDLKSLTSYDNRLCTAYLNCGRAAACIDRLESLWLSTSLTTRAPTAPSMFPSGGFLGILIGAPELYARCVELAKRLVAERGVYGAVNMLWVHHFCCEQYEQADAFYQQYLVDQHQLFFRGITEKAVETLNFDMIDKLYHLLINCGVSQNAKNILFTTLISVSAQAKPADFTSDLINRIKFNTSELRSDQIHKLQQLCSTHGVQLNVESGDCQASLSASVSSSVN